VGETSCFHSPGHICHPHWSCCGNEDETSKQCTSVLYTRDETLVHRGMWRDFSLNRVPCSSLAQPDGELCLHYRAKDDKMESSHWSCCGSTDREAKQCVRVLSHDTNLGTNHKGVWRQQRRGLRCSRPGSDEDGPLCEHGKIIRDNHWSCCGSTDKDAFECVSKEDTNLGTQHEGVWRKQLGDKFCSIPHGGEDGPFCYHPTRVIRTPHWSCCGSTDQDKAECPKRSSLVSGFDPKLTRAVRYFGTTGADFVGSGPSIAIGSEVINQDNRIRCWFVNISGNGAWSIGMIPEDHLGKDDYLMQSTDALCNSKLSGGHGNSLDAHKKKMSVEVDSKENVATFFVDGYEVHSVQLKDELYPYRLGVCGFKGTRVKRFEGILQSGPPPTKRPSF